MLRDFEIAGGIYLRQAPFELDLHNDFDFHSLEYSVEFRTLELRWRRTKGAWVSTPVPAGVMIVFKDVDELRMYPRQATNPFTEDDCLSTFGCWTDEAWADGGVFLVEPHETPEPQWLTALEFMSGAVIAVRASSAQARVEA